MDQTQRMKKFHPPEHLVGNQHLKWDVVDLVFHCFLMFSPSTTPSSVANIYPVRPIVEMCMDWSGGITVTFLGTG